jgi:hypothetical protein
VDGLTDRPRLAAVLIRALLIDPDGTMPPERFVVRIDMSSLGLPLPSRDEIVGRGRRQAPIVEQTGANGEATGRMAAVEFESIRHGVHDAALASAAEAARLKRLLGLRQ